MGGRDDDGDYEFLQITEAVALIGQKVDLFGVVSLTSIPRQSKGTDYYCSLRILDESKPTSGISVNFFTETMDKLPQVQCAGDIIQLSRVVMKTHGSEAFAVFNKKYSSFALFEGKHGTSFVPYQASSNYDDREQDKKFIVGLRKWMVDHPTATVSGELRLLKDIERGEHFSWVCKILHLRELQKDQWILFTWDGTDTPAVAIESKLKDENENPLPLQIEQFHLPREILSSFPTVGSVLRVIIGLDEKPGFDFLKIGGWVKLCNLRCDIHASMWFGTIMHFTKVCRLPDDDELILEKQRTYYERFKSKWGRIPAQSFPWPFRLTETLYPKVPFMTLMDVLTYPEVTAKFKVVARVVAMLPWRPEDFVSPSSGIYRIRLTLEDPTARIHAYLFADDAVKFFGGYYPADVMMRKRNALLGMQEGREVRNPPWLELCLWSYYIDEGDVWGSRSYRIFATIFDDERQGI
ncbi:hypothetical protein M9H77_10285 [Catharanthus roseus]|uniref:Uncharacterized protein n=1 Tax=Catharanthus roseus TaxID=4058 RepID=A0ACC0C382_CATRO|nr:hypothetical protein M9H77_10285 [Catharanthus roseus]